MFRSISRSDLLRLTAGAVAAPRFPGIARADDTLQRDGVWANRNADKTADILMKYTKLPETTVRTMRRATIVDLTAKYGNVPRFALDEMVFHP